MDASKALALVQQHGPFGLGGYDGCLCTSFEVHGVHVDIACRKSGGSWATPDKPGFYGSVVRVYSDHLDTDRDGLRAVAKEVAVALLEHAPVRFRFMDYRHDKECLCAYCGKHRDDAAGYLCAEHSGLSEDYDMRPAEIDLEGWANIKRRRTDHD